MTNTTKEKLTQLYLKKYKKQGWKEITEDQKNGSLFLLLVEDSLTPLQDRVFSVTLGFNILKDTGEDLWKMSGWDWSADSFVQDTTGKPLLYKQFEHNLLNVK